MKPSSSEVATALYGAWRLALFDSNAMQYFDKSVDGFWKSFYAAFFWIPVSTGLSYAILTKIPDSEFNLLNEIMADVAYLFAFPFVFLGVCIAMGWRKNFIACVVALNWTRVIHTVISIPMVLVFTEGLGALLLDPESASQTPPSVGVFLLLLGFLIYLLAYEIFIFSRSLSISLPAGFGVVILEFFITVVWVMATFVIIGVADGVTS